jgi:hypothetical protein
MRCRLWLLVIVGVAGCPAENGGADAGQDLAASATDDLATHAGARDLAILDDGGSATCPSAMPTTGSCASAALSCAYGTATCNCVGPELQWACCGPQLGPDCPSQDPVNGAPCCTQQPSAPPMCGYACGSAVARTCTCTSMHWSCVSGGC